jgi:hypothetical protein
MKQFNDPLPNGGVPFFANDFTFMQDMQMALYNIMLEQYYAMLPGNNASLILSGLTVSLTGTTTINIISSGHVILNKKLYWFNGASSLAATDLYIIPGSPAETETRPLENNSTGVVKIENIAVHTTTVPTSGPFIRFNPLPTVYLNDLMFRASKKIGEIIPLGRRNGTSTPDPLFGPNGLSWFSGTGGAGKFSYDGFALCNGNNGTPNLQGRFMVGYQAGASVSPPNVTTGKEINYGAIGNTGGLLTVPLTKSNIPTHTHTAGALANDSKGNHSHDIKWNGNSTIYGGSGLSVNSGSDLSVFPRPQILELKSDTKGDHSHTITGNTEDGTISGLKISPDAHENRPPYYTTAFIQRIS